MTLRLRPVEVHDLPELYRMQLDPESNRLAAVIPRTREAFNEHWQRILADPTISAHCIILDETVVGTVNCFTKDGQSAIGYWIDRPYWGRSIASRAVAMLLEIVATRPLVATLAAENKASIRVLEKCGFRKTGASDSPGD